ncbi:preprotein translocase subunit YajC [Orrella sp. JC864]|uniref:preprotein translocase subunit YajC n=1 Tax=Orrella sp. JC864 TaxID=3120298 RepID=UPI0012BBFF19
MLATDTLGIVLAQAAPGGEAGGALMGMLPIILMFVILYFLMIRPQMKRQKAHRQLLSELAKGDEVVTAGGILGKVTKVSDNYVTVEVAELADKPVEIILQKPSVSAVLPKGTIKAL